MGGERGRGRREREIGGWVREGGRMGGDWFLLRKVLSDIFYYLLGL
jgi:hypothetical protein